MMPPLIKDWPLTMTVTIAELVASTTSELNRGRLRIPAIR